MVPVIDRHHVLVAVHVIFEGLGISIVRSEAGRTVIKHNLRYARESRSNECLIQGVSGPKFIQYRRTKGVNEAELVVGEEGVCWTQESACRAEAGARRGDGVLADGVARGTAIKDAKASIGGFTDVPVQWVLKWNFSKGKG